MPKPTFIVDKFRLFRRSENRNSFCLREYWLMNRDGACFTACRAYDLPRNGEVTLRKIKGLGDDRWDGFAELGFEIPEYKGKAPANVVAEVFAEPAVECDVGKVEMA